METDVNKTAAVTIIADRYHLNTENLLEYSMRKAMQLSLKKKNAKTGKQETNACGKLVPTEIVYRYGN